LFFGSNSPETTNTSKKTQELYRKIARNYCLTEILVLTFITLCVNVPTGLQST